MPKLALFFESIFARFFTFLTVHYGAQIATKMTVIFAIAALYVSGILSFNIFISPLLAELFATDFGMVIGLAFPPIAQYVITGLITLWAAMIIYRYLHTFGLALIQR